MKLKTLIILILFSLVSTQALAFKLKLHTSFASKKLVGEQSSSGLEGEIISNANLHYGFGISTAINERWQFIFDYKTGDYKFNNDESVISGAESISLSSTDFGLRWILFARTAFRFLYKIQEDVGFEVNGANQAELYKENQNIVSVYYDQIVFLGVSLFSGFKLGFDVMSQGSEIESRQATNYGVFVTWNTGGLGILEFYYELRNINKSDSDLDYVENDANFNINYSVGF